ncbi:hypothetical protein [Phenylobacterium sp.]|uniref:hypothetical protein n=1 Tax=Phenylobacterium sp. TaxID=1871053 RepID=UPI002736EEBB|nr:hypothetical protein [Phenylobacterium sp.]MDP3852627.1 hypothetical protein [Phenylobacterium sp.]
MRLLNLAAIAAISVSLGGCAYNAPVGVSPNLNVYSSYGEKVPGRFALFVDSEAFNTTVRPTGLNCAAHSFPLDLRQSFEASTVSTMRQLVDEVQVVERPIPATQLAAQGLAGQVTVSAETVTARVQVISGFWSSTADSVVELSAGLLVDSPTSRVLGTTAQGFGNAQQDAGAFCGNTANAIGVATEKAMRQLLGQLGERMSNSERLRRVAIAPANPTAPRLPQEVREATPVLAASPPKPRKGGCVRVTTDPSQNRC